MPRPSDRVPRCCWRYPHKHGFHGRETVAVRLYHFIDAWAGILSAGAIDPAFSPRDDGTPQLVHFSNTACIESLP